MNIIVGVSKHDNPRDVDEAYGTGTYDRLFPKARCVDCGDTATHIRHYRDVCPTDRGDEVREGDEGVCDDCYPMRGEI